MSSYIQTFASRSAFRTWRNTLTSSNAGAYVCKITGTNETLSFSINVGKPVQQAGLGDLIVYDSGDGCFKAYPQSILECPKTSDNLTGMYCKLSEVYPSALSGCTQIGTVIDKAGSKLKIAAIQSGTGKAWYGTSSSYSLLLNGVHTSSQIRNGKGGTYWTGAWNWVLTNNYYASNPDYVSFWIGVTKSAWDTAVTNYKAGTGDGSVTATGQIAGTYYVQDYNYDYDEFQRRTILCRFPAQSTDANAILNGREQTRKIVDALYTQASIAKTDTSLAAGYCWNYAAGSVAGFGAGSWWLPTIDEAIKINKARAMIGTGGYWDIWTCVQYDASVAWVVNSAGRVRYDDKYRGYYAVPVAALDISNL